MLMMLVCRFCGKSFPFTRLVREPAPEFCSVDCRFWAKVDKNGPTPAPRPIPAPHLDPCWVWTAATGKYGYGAFGTGVGSDVSSAHRLSFYLAHGRWPEPHCLHHCDNPPCVNPTHLWEGTNQDNVDDKMRKSRQAAGETSGPRLHPDRMQHGEDHWTRRTPERVARGTAVASPGELHPMAEMTWPEVRILRAAYDAGETQVALAARFDISQPHVSKIVRNESWIDPDYSPRHKR